MFKDKRIAITLILLLTILIVSLVWSLINQEKERIVQLPQCEHPVETLASSAEQENVLIDFGQCDPCQNQIPVAFGSATYRIVSRSSNSCLFEYGGEVENPTWDGELQYRCEVPLTLGEKRLEIGLYGINFSVLSEYCTKLSESF